ncbi:MAG: hypothetical protein KJZ58_06230 [Flavobacteriales bacterium]|nr:hypothetical protein [Flavobacteriales bacterium]MCL4281842.1 hypothetical protein [Flavobacteriales bacterium]
MPGRKGKDANALRLSYLYFMPIRNNGSKKKMTKAPLTSKALREASVAATEAASKAAFEVVDTLLVVRDGWLVKVDKDGKVRRKVKRIQLPAA